MYYQIETVLLIIIYLQFVVCHLNFNAIEASNGDYIEILMNITEAFQCLSIQLYQDINEEVYRNMFKHLFIPVTIGDLRFNSCKQQLLVVDENYNFNVETFSIDIVLILLVLYSDCSKMAKITQAYRSDRKMLIICASKSAVHLIRNSELTNNMSHLSELFDENTKRLPNYSGKSLSVFTFNCPLFSYGTIGDIDSSSNRTGELDGIEMKIFLEVAKELNFSWKLREPPELNKWGYRLNGTWSGGIKGPLANGTADVGFCCLWLVVPQAEDYDLTVPWDILCNTFVVPRPRRKTSVGAIFTPFEWAVWCVLILVTLLITFIVEYLLWISFRIHYVPKYGNARLYSAKKLLHISEK